MKALKYIGIGMGVLVAIFLIVAAVVPKEYSCAVTREIKVPGEVVFNQVNTLSNWENWDPWVQMDTSIKGTYEGPASGVGAKRTWTSEKSGSGSMTVTESIPGQSIKNTVTFGDWDSEMNANFTFKESEGGTQVTWSSSGTMSYPLNILNLTMGDAIEKEYARGLENLEKASTEKWMGMFAEKNAETRPMVSVKRENVPPTELANAFAEMYTTIQGFVNENELEMVGAPFAVYHRYSQESIDVEAGIPVAPNEAESTDEITVGVMPSGKMLSTVHKGSYDDLGKTHNMIKEFIKMNEIQTAGPPIEVYISDPVEVSPEELTTEVMYPISG